MSVVDVRAADGPIFVRGSFRAEVVAAGEQWSVAQRELVRVVTALDASHEWALDGEPTCAHWVAAALGVEICTAREWLRVGRALRELPVMNLAFGAGRLSYSKVRALTRIATAATQTELCALAERVPAANLNAALAGWLARRETPEETEARHLRARRFSSRLDFDGMVVGTFRLPPAEAAKITIGIDTRVAQRRPPKDAPDASAGVDARWPSIAQQRADALVELADGADGSVVTEIVLHVRADGCSFDNGTPLAETVVERLVPDAFIRALIHDAESRPINASGRQRHPTTRQRRVVLARDRACVDCGTTEFLEFDHEPDYRESQHTIVDELRVRCPRCHRARHRAQHDADDQGDDQLERCA